jgi:hypothetical protein
VVVARQPSTESTGSADSTTSPTTKLEQKLAAALTASASASAEPVQSEQEREEEERQAVVQIAGPNFVAQGSGLCCAVLCCAVLCCAVLCCAEERREAGG